MQASQSYWMSSTRSGASYEPLEERRHATVAVVGAGITGLTTALLLKQAGVDVTVLEGDVVGSGVTGHTTGKLTAGQGVRYSGIEDEHGTGTARMYGDAQVAAVELVFDLVDDLEIECDLQRVADYVYAETEEEVEALEHELDASRRAGLTRILDARTSHPVATALAALRLDEQGQLHARKYTLGLARAVHGDSGCVHESTRVVEIEPRGDAIRVVTAGGEVHADHVVLATNAPITSKGLLFARAHPWRAYAVAAHVPRGTLPAGTWINAGSPTRSLRTAPLDGNEQLLIVVGEAHRVGQEDDTESHYDALAEYLDRNFPGTSVRYRWSTQDEFSTDGLPFIGRVGDASSRTYVATGFEGWGLTNGTVGAILIRDAILDRPNPWKRLFDPNRSALAHGVGSLVTENANVAKQLVVGRLRARPGDVDGISPDSGAVVSIEGQRAAVFRDEAGSLHAVSGSCTHMGCVVEWNAAERTWDCPCHGSRFATDGTVLHGPAKTPLERVDLGAEALV
jgi:glycine/D-amino acid oxidase-like deaminating enzyme/nitrite reductase/ring-hydroxylating ferredoxin subunit